MYTANGELVNLNEARRNLIPPRPDGRAVTPSTLFRWIRHGLAGPDDERIRLDVVYVGSRPYVTPDALERFFTRVTAARRTVKPSIPTATSATNTELAKAGLR